MSGTLSIHIRICASKTNLEYLEDTFFFCEWNVEILEILKKKRSQIITNAPFFQVVGMDVPHVVK